MPADDEGQVQPPDGYVQAVVGMAEVKMNQMICVRTSLTNTSPDARYVYDIHFPFSTCSEMLCVCTACECQLLQMTQFKYMTSEGRGLRADQDGGRPVRLRLPAELFFSSKPLPGIFRLQQWLFREAEHLRITLVRCADCSLRAADFVGAPQPVRCEAAILCERFFALRRFV
mgnify:CR=1 FL=1